ncbi:MAG: lipid-A-disaccharide synthase [Chitinivibrionia bacterium]|nr:lipid-A-disaccharide synthase [Chitinivibrionia bacterium]
MKILFSAGDVSGDNNTAGIIAELKRKYPSAQLSGLGGSAMQAAGFKSDFEFSKFNKMGYWEVIKNLPFFLAAQKKFIQKMRDEKPNALVCVDFSGFNKKLVVEANKLGIPVLWFIAPMIWVWKKEKYLRFFEKYPAHIACIFPFEPKHWSPRVKTVSFVGNPLLENLDWSAIGEKKAINPQAEFTLALIAGSREQEVRKMLPFMTECAKNLKELYPKIKIIVSKAPFSQDLYECAEGENIEFETDFLKVLQKADFALATSGTASLQLGLAGVGHIVLYKTSPLTFAIFKAIIKKKPLIGLTNIVVEKEIMPEFLQSDMAVENVVGAVQKILENPAEQEKIIAQLRELRGMLGDKKTSVEVVNLIESLI